MNSRLAGAALLSVGLAGTACGSSDERVELVVMGTTDVHGYLLPYEYATGGVKPSSLAQIATLVDSIRARHPDALLVDSGDLLQGSPLDEYQARVAMDSVHPVIATMNAMQYDASAIGNHEFNYGIEYLDGALEAARFPFLAANIRIAGTDSLAFPPYRIVEASGVRVGIVGFTTPGVMVWDRSNVEGRLEFDDIVQSARVWAPRVREAGADVLIAIAHSGVGPGSTYEYADVPEENALDRLASEVPEFALIFAGHTASAIDGLRVGQSLILHAGRHADHLAVARIRLRRENGSYEVADVAGTTLPAENAVPSERVMSRVADAHDRTVAWLEEPIGQTPDRWTASEARLRDTPISDLVAAVQRDLTGAELSSSAVFRPEAEFGPGPITRRDILGLYIYPNTLRAIRISGAQLRTYLEWSARYFNTLPAQDLVNDSVPGYNFDIVDGVDYTLDLTKPPGRRVTRLEVAGRPVAPTDSFTLALNNYRQTGGGGAPVAGAPLVYQDEVDIAGRIIDFVQRRGTLRASDVFRKNWELVPEAAIEEAAAGGKADGR